MSGPCGLWVIGNDTLTMTNYDMEIVIPLDVLSTPCDTRELHDGDYQGGFYRGMEVLYIC